MSRSYKDHSNNNKKKTPKQSHRVHLTPYKRDRNTKKYSEEKDF